MQQATLKQVVRTAHPQTLVSLKDVTAAQLALSEQRLDIEAKALLEAVKVCVAEPNLRREFQEWCNKQGRPTSYKITMLKENPDGLEIDTEEIVVLGKQFTIKWENISVNKHAKAIGYGTLKIKETDLDQVKAKLKEKGYNSARVAYMPKKAAKPAKVDKKPVPPK